MASLAGLGNQLIGWGELSDLQRRAAMTLGLSAAQWPPPDFDQQVWRYAPPSHIHVSKPHLVCNVVGIDWDLTYSLG